MHDIIIFLKGLMNVDNLATLIQANHGLGLYVVALIIFAETGLFIGFFLPGDSLLFVSGLVVASPKSSTPFASNGMNLVYWIILIAFAGVIGNLVGYWFGRKTGPLLFERKDTLLFKKKHLLQASAFYDKKGGAAIIFARFLPIVRTFAPIVAGVVKMEKGKFIFYNVIGSLAWVSSMMVSGYFLGEMKFVKDHFELIVIGLILVTTGPVLFKMIFGKHPQPILETGNDVARETIK